MEDLEAQKLVTLLKLTKEGRTTAWIERGGETHSKCGGTIPWTGGTGLKKKEKVN